MDDPFALNIQGVQNLISSGENKVRNGENQDEGVESEYIDILELPMTDEELRALKNKWEGLSSPYTALIKPRQEKNKIYYLGMQKSTQTGSVAASNLLFEAEETFIPQALSKNPEPVVFSDNTEDGKLASNDIKTMLQFHADVLCLRRKLGVMVRHWSIYFLGVLKHGWDEKTSDIKTEIRKPQNFVLDPDGYIDEFGNYCGRYLGERIECTAEKLIEMFPEHKAYIEDKTQGKLGTSVVRTEWWTDEYCFTSFQEEILDKHKNEFFKYDGENHFSTPKMPYTFLSVFSLQERPHDITNLIEQNIPNQDQITETDDEIMKNVRIGVNGVVLDDKYFTSETAGQARDSLYQEALILGNKDAVTRLPANPIPNGLLEVQQDRKETLRGIFGTEGLASNVDNQPDTARGMILNQSHDSTRIGGGIGDALEQVADNVFNWWLQLYYVFYDEPHFAAIMGSGGAVDYVKLIMSNENRKFVVSVSPNSMAPKDEITEMNQAIELWNAKALDPITLFKKLNYPDPMESAKQVSLWVTNPQLYMQMYFPEQAPNSPNPQTGQINPQVQGTPPETPSAEPASASLSNVPLNNPPQ